MSQGLWSTFRRGEVQIGEKKLDLIGRSYLQGHGDHDLIKEIALLRLAVYFTTI
jgi:hypothetical protein